MTSYTINFIISLVWKIMLLKLIHSFLYQLSSTHLNFAFRIINSHRL